MARTELPPEAVQPPHVEVFGNDQQGPRPGNMARHEIPIGRMPTSHDKPGTRGVPTQRFECGTIKPSTQRERQPKGTQNELNQSNAE